MNASPEPLCEVEPLLTEPLDDPERVAVVLSTVAPDVVVVVAPGAVVEVLTVAVKVVQILFSKSLSVRLLLMKTPMKCSVIWLSRINSCWLQRVAMVV